MFENWMLRRTPWSGNVFAEMDRLHKEMERLFTRRRDAAEFPPISVWANADGVMVVAEVPGLRPDDVDVSVSGGMLTLRGERKNDGSLGEQSRAERPQGSFTRTLELPFQIEPSKVEAHSENGLLAIRLPRSEADKPRKITVGGD